jgi:RNA recognition motif-containing protein
MTKKKNRYLDSVMNPHSDIHEKFLNQTPPPPKMKALTKKELREQQWYDKMKKHIGEAKDSYKNWNPFEIDGNEKCTEDPYKTILVANLAYATDEDRLREVFEIYGHIKSVILDFVGGSLKI